MTIVRLAELARVIRSKNVGPFMIALDIVFDTREDFDRVVRSGAISRESISAIYRIPPETITDVVYYAPGNAIKVSLIRPIPSGNVGDADVLGAQQYAPLHDVEIP